MSPHCDKRRRSISIDQEDTVVNTPNRPSKRSCVDEDGTVCQISLHPLASNDGLIVKVTPPTQPVNKHLDHVPCEIVLVIDVSGSMDAAAPVPSTETSGEREHVGMTVLDLTKHAAKTIIATLDDNDSLSIVTFSTKSKV